MDYIKSGKEAGAKVVAGGERVGSKGYFLRPTIFVDVKDEMKIAKEEVFENNLISKFLNSLIIKLRLIFLLQIFGPVVAVFKFKDVAEVLKRAKYINRASFELFKKNFKSPYLFL